MITPLGFPVVPEVYSTVAGSSGSIPATRSATVPGAAASRSRPRSRRSAQVRYWSPGGHAAASLTITFFTPGSSDSTGCQRASSAGPSSTAIVAPQSAAT